MNSLSNCASPFKNSRNVRWDRLEYAEKVASVEKLEKAGLSQRDIAKELEVPRTTLQCWKTHRNSLDSDPKFIALMESGLGLAFIHRLCTAAHVVFVEAGACGVAMVSKFLELSCLDRFVASSKESQLRVNRTIQTAIVDYVSNEQKALQAIMPNKEITICQDETFTGGLCLVAIEPESGFILLEKKAEDRSCETWSSHMNKTLQGMNVTVVQSTSDEGKGILAYAEHTLGVAHSPDIFHVQHELCKAVSAPIAAKVRQAERAVDVAKSDLEALKVEQEDSLKNIETRGRGRPKDFDQRVASAGLHLESEVAEFLRIKAVQEELRANNRGISDAYHFLDPLTGKRQSPAIVADKIQVKIDGTRYLAEQENLRESSLARIDKAERVLPKITASLEFVSSHIRREIDKLEVSPTLVTAIHTRLLPAEYLLRLAVKENKKERLELEARARNLTEPLYTDGGAMTLLPIEQRTAIEKRAYQLARIFQRSSSCVEGRNGVLSFRHHELHTIGDRKRLVLTALHNYFITRSDGTTAAERFFESKPSDLFQAVLAATEIPARPSSPPRKISVSAMQAVS